MGDYSFAAGYNAQALHNLTFVWSDGYTFSSSAANQFLIHATGGVGINKNNPATALDVNGTVTASSFSGSGTGLTSLNAANLSGTIVNSQLANNSVNVFTSSPLSGGGSVALGGSLTLALTGTVPLAQLPAVVLTNAATGANAVALGYQTSAGAQYAVVSGGARNAATGAGAVVAGGGYDGSSINANTASGPGSAIVGGTQNIANSSRSTVGGGHNNSATNWYATVPGGAWNIAGGQGSFAAGQAARALNDGSFVWNCDFGNPLSSSAANQFIARASGGYSFYTGTSVGATLAAGSGSWTSMSDRNMKENFTPVDVAAVLQKVAALPLSTWNYKQQADSIRHLGPMAQDFKAAFKVGETDTGITTVDADGVALAAIQGLNQKLNEKDAEIQDLKVRLEKLEQFLNAGNGGGK